jgi:hypothetical protein
MLAAPRILSRTIDRAIARILARDRHRRAEGFLLILRKTAVGADRVSFADRDSFIDGVAELCTRGVTNSI